MCILRESFGLIADFQVEVIAENLRHCTQRCYCWSSRGALHHRMKQQGPTTTATCYVVSLSQALGGLGRETNVTLCRGWNRQA